MTRPAVCLIAVITLVAATVATADFTPKHRRALKDVRRQLATVALAVRKNDFGDAREKLAAAESSLDEIVADSGLTRDDAAFRSVVDLLNDRRADIGEETAAPSKATGKPSTAGVSFVSDVAPVLASRCVRCHRDGRTSGGLNLATFANMKAGGDSGPLVVRGNADGSPLYARCAEEDPELRMPKGGQLQDDELTAIGAWIAAGAAFDGDSETTALARLKSAGSAASTVEVVVPEPTGSETVSFTRDIGPMLDRICLDCHSGANPTGGLSMTTFAGLMRGGESGAVIIPGDAEGSRLFRLVGGLELPRMPGNMSRIRRSEYAALKTWFAEGNTFDGPDAEALLTSYILTPERQAAAARSERSASEWHEHRRTATADLWKKAMRLIEPKFAESEDVFAAGNVDDLPQLAAVAQKQLATLASAYGIETVSERAVSLLVIDTPYGHKEIARTLADRAPGRNDTFHGHSADGGEVLYAAVNTSRPSDATLSVDDRVRAAVTAAFVASLADDVPALLSEGLARVAVQPSQSLPAAKRWTTAGADAVRRAEAAKSFDDAEFSSETIGPAGYVLVRGLIKSGGEGKVKSLLRLMSDGQSFAEATSAAYGMTPSQLAVTVRASL